MWLSWPHLVCLHPISNSTAPLGVELNWNQNSIQLARRTQLNYIIVRRPLDLWNRMFNRHQAEITVMQFRGHSLPVHHSVVYHGNYLVPFHQPISAHAISSPNCHWNVSLPSGASPWNSIFWGRVEGQNITPVAVHKMHKKKENNAFKFLQAIVFIYDVCIYKMCRIQ